MKVFDTIHRQRNMLALNDEKASLDMQVAWAKQNGWQARDADELGALGERIGRGEQARVPDGPWWNNDILELLMQNIPISRNTRSPIEC